MASLEAEQSVLGALLLDNSAFDTIGDKLKPADFSVAAHRTIFARMTRLFAAGFDVDVVTLNTALVEADEADRVGGLPYLGELLANVPSARNVMRYTRTVIDHRIERDLATTAATIADIAERAGPISERLDEAQALLLSLTESSASDDPLEVTEILPGWLDELEARYNRGGEISGLPTGLVDLDEKTSGLQPGDLIVVAGRPGMGKTSLAMHFARHAAMHDKSALVFSMEMSRNQLVQLSVAALGRVSSTKLRNGKLVGDDWDNVSAGVGRLHQRKLIIDDRSALSVEQIRTRARRTRRKHGLDLIVIDYLQLMRVGHEERRDLQIAAITAGLKSLARELGVPVVILSQLNRALESRGKGDRRPVMSDLRDSGGIEQDADVIIFVYRDEVYNENSEYRGIAELIIGKQRMGEVGTARVAWLGEFNTFENLDRGWRAPEPPQTKRQHKSARPSMDD